MAGAMTALAPIVADGMQISAPRFDVVSVKRSAPPPGDGPTLGMPGAFLPGGPTPSDAATTRRFMAMNVELEVVLHRAYPEFASNRHLARPRVE